jgi:GTPase SAR1 family protein
MKTTEMLSKIKALLNATINLAEMKLDNGTVLEAESFEAGASVFIKTDDEKVALPIGEYKLEDGRSLIVEEEGIIASIGEVAVEAEDEVIETEVPEEIAPEVEAIVEAVVEVVAPAIEEVKEELKKLKKKFEDAEKKEEKKEEEEKTAMSRKFRHSPERNTKKKQEIRFSQNKQTTTLDRVLNILK